MSTQIDDFADIANNTNCDDARYWDYTGDSPDSNAKFVTGTLQDIECYVTNGENFIRRIADPPAVEHQRVEVTIPNSGATSGVSLSGCFARYVDVDNLVLAYFDHTTGEAKLVERIAGVDTVLATAPITAASDVTGVSLRLEVIGNRARLFFENHYRPIPDQPPDIAADLTADAESGNWGMYLSADVSNTARISRFSCRELPSVVAPPPSFSMEVPSIDVLAFTAAVTSVPSSATLLEWEIYPVDQDDFPDPYKELSLASITSRVFFGRPGYAYDVRVRTVKKSGGFGDWIVERITLTGSATAPAALTLPDDEFPDVTPDYVLSRRVSAQTNAFMAETGRERVTTNQPEPRNSFSLQFKARTRDEITQLETFHARMKGSYTPFVFTHPLTGDQFPVRFASDQFEASAIDDEYDGTGPIYDLSLDLIEVRIGVVSSISLSLEVDSSLLP